MRDLKLEIRLLGPVEIFYNGEPVKISRRAERAILYFLAIENRPVSRETLIDHLWPKAEQADPRATLRTALSRLRNNLPDKKLLVTELDQVSLDFSRCSIDLVNFSKSYQSLQGLLSGFSNDQPLPIQIVNQIEKSLDLWRGDRIIEGDSFYDYPELAAWSQGLNKDLETQRMSLMRNLAAHYQASGQLQTALDVFIHLGRLNNQDNSFHLAVMDLLTKLGRHEEVQRFCDSLELLFESEYNAPLPDEIILHCRELYKQIDSSHGWVDQKWPISSSSFNPPLVGRTAELAQLKSTFYRGGLVKIEGVVGVGKTRMVQELFETLSPKPFLILAPGRENETALPFAPIIHGLRQSIPQDIWKEIDKVWANQLSLMLPELGKIRKDISPSPGGKLTSASQHLFDALHHLLVLVAKKYGRILFFLDDVQWVDGQTKSAIFYLVNQGFFDDYGLLIVTSQLVEKNLDFDIFLDQQQRKRHVELIHLTGLNPEEMKNLVQHVLNQSVSIPFLEGLYRETQGVPFWTLEIMRHLLDTYGESKALQEVTRFPLIKSTYVFIRSRFYRFKQEARYLLSCAAIIGDDIPISLLQAVSDLPTPEFLSVLDTLINNGFLVTNETDHKISGRTLAFSHEKLREVVLLETSNVHHQALHQKVACELVKAADTMGRAAIIAEHFRESGDLVMAFSWHIKAAKHAWNLGAANDVVWSLTLAEKIFLESSQVIFTAEDVFNLYFQWSDFAYQSNLVNVLEDLGVKIEQLAQKKPDWSMAGLSHLVLAKACFLREDFETGLELSRKAVEELIHSQQRLEPKVQAFFLQALFEWWTLDLKNIHFTADQIIKLIESSASDSSFRTTAQFLAKRMVCDAYVSQGEANAALQHAQEVFQQFYNKLDTFNQMRAYYMLAHAFFIAGHYKKSEECAQKGLKIAQLFDNTIAETIALLVLCKAEIVLGCFDKAFELAMRALSLAERNHNIHNIVNANTLLGDIFYYLDHRDRATHYYRIAQVRQRPSAQSYFGLENNIHLARLLTSKGEYQLSKKILEQTLTVTEKKGLMALYVEALITEGLMLNAEGDLMGAEAGFLKAVSIAESKGLVQEAAWGKYHLACMAYLQGNYEQVKEPLVSVLAITRSREMVILNKTALELAIDLSGKQSIGIELKQLAADHHAQVAKIQAYTRSEALREQLSFS